jgi:hypothetical protein
MPWEGAWAMRAGLVGFYFFGGADALVSRCSALAQIKRAALLQPF